MAIAILGVGLGYRSFVGLAGFVGLWALFLCPLIAILALGFYLLSRRAGLIAWWHFGVAGLLGGISLAFFWGQPQLPTGASSFPQTGVYYATAAFVGALTGMLFWRLAVTVRA